MAAFFVKDDVFPASDMAAFLVGGVSSEPQMAALPVLMAALLAVFILIIGIMLNEKIS